MPPLCSSQGFSGCWEREQGSARSFHHSRFLEHPGGEIPGSEPQDRLWEERALPAAPGACLSLPDVSGFVWKAEGSCCDFADLTQIFLEVLFPLEILISFLI